MHLRPIVLTFFCFVCLLPAKAQRIIWVEEGDKGFMHKVNGEWQFNDSLPDGHYIAYAYGKGIPSIDLVYRNSKKEGMESRYYAGGKDKYETITWKNGLKNGTRTGINTNGTIGHIMNFNDGVLDGYMEVNWREGEKNYNGFYKMGFRDSVWNYYSSNDQTGSKEKFRKYRQYKFVNGKRYLVSAWNNRGKQTVKNGTGFTEMNNEDDALGVEHFENGLRNGIQKTKINLDHYCLFDCKESPVERVFRNDLLVRETAYYGGSDIAYQSTWIYDGEGKADTMNFPNEIEIDNTYFKHISFKNTPIRDGHWIARFENGVKKYEGDYDHGKRTGVWIWNYQNGMTRIIGNYATNTWQHFDSTGQLKSDLKNEFLTLLNDHGWISNGPLDSSIVILERHHIKVASFFLGFQHDGQLQIIETPAGCEASLDKNPHTYLLLGDKLFISPSKKKQPISVGPFSFRIISATDDQIVLKREDIPLPSGVVIKKDAPHHFEVFNSNQK